MMADACCPPATTPARDQCQRPGCGQSGRSIANATVQAQVAMSLRELAAGGYDFCATACCPIVYFTAYGEALRHEQLRERVFQKDAGDDVLVCYCFQHTKGDLPTAVRGSAPLYLPTSLRAHTWASAPVSCVIQV